MRSIKAHYATPYEAISDKKWWKYGESGKPGARERAVAIRDVQCKDKSNLTRTWWKSESEIQDELIRENGEYFTRILRAKEEKLRYASRIINRS